MLASMVHPRNLILVDGQVLEGVHGDEDGARASVDEVEAEAGLNVGHDGGLIEGIEVIHVLHAICCLRGAWEQAQGLLCDLAAPTERRKAPDGVSSARTHVVERGTPSGFAE